MNKRESFLAAARSQIGKGIYVWGGNGEDLLAMASPEKWIRKRETSAANADRAIALFEERKRHGVREIRAFDCSGLVYWSQKEAKVGYSDYTAAGYYKQCDPVEHLEAGDLVFHHDGQKIVHVGICDTNGYVIESMGRDDGVVMTKRKDANYWNRSGRLKKLKNDYCGLRGDVNLDGKVTAADAALILRWLDGLDELSEEQLRNADFDEDGAVTREDAEAILRYVTEYHVRVIGKSVRVREGYTTLTRTIGIVHRGDVLPCIGAAPNGWYKVEYKGVTAYITNKAKYTELEGD